MATIKQLRQRIRSAKNIQQITRAMKLVAAARLRRAQERVLEARSYSEKMHEMIASMATAGELPEHPILVRRPVNKYGVILVTAERGLCGSFNTNLNRKAFDLVRSATGTPYFLCVGKKGKQFFEKRGYDVAYSSSLATTGATKRDAEAVFLKAQDMFVNEEVDAIYLLYSKFFSPIRQVPQVVQLLPIEPPKVEDQEAVKHYMKSYAFEPEPKELMAELLPRYAMTIILQGLLESAASEHGARMTAMTNATDSAGEMISNLTLQANRQRQAAITKEILEVVSGAEALKS